MFDKLWDFVKKTGKKIVRFGMDKDQPVPEPRVGYNEYMRTHPEQKKAEAPVQKQEEKKLVHPVTKEEVAPLKNVYKDPLSYIKVLSDSTFGKDHWEATKKIIMDESGGNPKAFNGTYRGLFQNNKDLFSSEDPSLDEQFKVWSNYIKTHADNRTGKPYGTPSQALDFRENEAPKYRASGDPRYASFSEHWY